MQGELWQKRAGEFLFSLSRSLTVNSISPATLHKYVVGIDVAKDTFVAFFGRIEPSQRIRFSKQTTFKNTSAGFGALLGWAMKQCPTVVHLWRIAESTGVYYEE